jgi:WD40 repeat protein
LASGSDDKTVKLWNTESHKEVTTLEGHSNAVKALTFSSDSKYLASGSEDYTVKLWNLQTLEQVEDSENSENFQNKILF